jgi:long-chain acyl-CoA synthetase
MTGGTPKTLSELFISAVERFRDQECMRFKRDGVWRSLNFGEVGRRVRELALGLHTLGINRADRIAIWSENRPEWNLADLASLAIGAVDVPIYSTQSISQVEYILADSGARAIFVSASFLHEAIELRKRIPSLQLIISFDETASIELKDDAGSVLTVEGLAESGRTQFGREPDLYDALLRESNEDDLATLLYTSGTTGEPKGVMLTHKNLVTNAINGCRWLGLEGRQDVALTYLPFSHIFERAVIYIYLHVGTVIAYAESIDAVGRNLLEVKPTVMTSVPRMFEKIYARIMQKGIEAGFPRKQIFFWALGVGRKWSEARDQGISPDFPLRLSHSIADILVFRKWREAVGGRIRSFISGGAPLAPEIAHLFWAAGLPILQGYGLTETSPVVSCNTEERNRIGTVGQVVTGVQVRIAADGEILVKGDTVMKGYYNRPDENAEAFTDDGWLRTGDIGHVDREGFLVITDRKKDLIKTSGGKYVAPQRIEAMIMASRFVSQVVVVGNQRKFPAALIVPNMGLLRDYARLKGIVFHNDEELLESPRIIDLLERQVEKYTTELARFEKVKKVALLPRELTTEGGELTPTLKPKRSFIETKYRDVIDRLYTTENSPVATV